MWHGLILTVSFAPWLLVSRAVAYNNLHDAYAALGFDPYHPDNSVVVLFSDPHMNLWETVLPVVTNLEPQLVDVINTMDPPPAKIIVAGDTSTTLSPVPGWNPRPWSMDYGTNEMLHWLNAIRAITNIDQTNIVWIPGNHDQLHFESDAETFKMMYPMMPTRQRLDIAGVRFFLLNCGNYGGRNPAQAVWLRDELSRTSTNQPVVVITHVPPFMGPSLYRGNSLELREIFADWPARWWCFSGHVHARSLQVYQIGKSRVACMSVGTASRSNTNGKSYDSGCVFLCLSNGIAGIVYYHYNDGSFEAVTGPKWEEPCTFTAAFEGVPGLLWRRLKSRAPAPEIAEFVGDDAVEWYSYTEVLRWILPLTNHANQATHFLLLAECISPTARLECLIEETNWVTLSFPQPTNSVYSIPLPEVIRTQPVAHLRYLGPRLNDFIAGWGLATSNPPPWITYPQLLPIHDQLVSPGDRVDIALEVVNPYSPPDKHKFTLLCGPREATVDEETGQFVWTTPTNPPAPSTNVVIKVQDDGTPPMTSTQQFVIRFANAYSWRTIVCKGDIWHYHDLGVGLATGWADKNYDDSAWPVGPGPLGFGNNDEATLLPLGSQLKPPTSYFRKTFTLTTVPESPEIRFALRCDDGAVVYLNGTEIFRYNLPAGPVQFDTPALTSIPQELKRTYIQFTAPVSLVRTGINVLAVEMHRYVSPLEPAAFWSFDELVPPWTDCVHGHVFAPVGTNLVPVPGRVGGCISNSASPSSWLETPDHPELRYTGPFTVGGWFVFGQQYGNDPATICIGKDGEFQLYYTGTVTNRYRFRVGQSEVQEQTPGTTSGQWRFVVAWFDGSNACIQMDNGPVYSAPADPPEPTTNPLVALKRAGVSGGFAADEVFFFKRVLSQQERLDIYNSGMREVLASNIPDLSMDFELSALLPRMPEFCTALPNLVRMPGEQAEFSHTVLSAFPVSYQWLFNGVPIDGATNSLLFLAAVRPEQSGLYSLVASNIGGAVTSAPACLTVLSLPRLGAHLGDGGALVLELPACIVASTVLTSTNLIDWEPVLTREAGAGPTNHVVEIVPTELQRYYRLRLDW